MQHRGYKKSPGNGKLSLVVLISSHLMESMCLCLVGPRILSPWHGSASASHTWGHCLVCSEKLLWDTVSSCHSGGHDLSRSQLVIAWWCIWRHQASGSEDVLIWLIGGDVRHQPSITQAWAAAIKIVTVITPSASQSENGQISLSHHIMFMVRFLTPHLLAAQCPPLLVLHPPYKAKQNRPHNLLSCVTFCPKNTLTW